MRLRMTNNFIGIAVEFGSVNTMKRSITFVLFATLVSACTHIATVGADSSAHLVERFVAAFNHLDVDEMNALFAEDATAYLPFADNAARVQGKKAILSALTPMFAAERKRHDGPDYLHLQATDLAIQPAGSAAVATFDVGTSDVHSRRTLILIRRNGTWRILHLHASNLRKPAG
jgi:uncharacterized protein (TIGR02246 family)